MEIMSGNLDPVSLPEAIRALLELNNYAVEGPVQIFGAEIDLVAEPKGDPFGTRIFIEATTEYVDNSKYGQDVGKLAFLREREPAAHLLIVSSKGFSLPVKERAKATRIQVLTYAEILAKFERFDPYMKAVFLSESEEARKVRVLNQRYVEPYFHDDRGRDLALHFLTEWRDAAETSSRCVFVIGDYGTGKTALTQVLQYRWLDDYRLNPARPIPLRVELGEFTRQFDALGLIHHALEKSALSHMSVSFAASLIRSGRVILLLDGYDEMAQHLYFRDRRASLEALAQLFTEGARGILTSRPNYFKEVEPEFWEPMYGLVQRRWSALGSEELLILQHTFQRYEPVRQLTANAERRLEDLSPEQSRVLVQRALAGHPTGQQAVLNTLERISGWDDNSLMALSGKPLIVHYLIEAAEELATASPEESEPAVLSEWDVYKLIIDRLMLREFRRSAEITPSARKGFLRALAWTLCRKGVAALNQSDFHDLVAESFSRELGRVAPDLRQLELDRLFAVLRSSATLTKWEGDTSRGWRFSHESLRDFLVAESLVESLASGHPPRETVPITYAMRRLVGSLPNQQVEELRHMLSGLWPQRSIRQGTSVLLTLLWDALDLISAARNQSPDIHLRSITGNPPEISGVAFSRLCLSSDSRRSNLDHLSCSGSELNDVDFTGASLQAADFSDSLLVNVRFRDADLRLSRFKGVLGIDVDFSGADLRGADFAAVSPNDISILIERDDPLGSFHRLAGEDAIGYLRRCSQR